MIPKDPVMLLSFVNLKLRDCYRSLGAMCDDMELEEEDIKKRLAEIDYHYKPDRNQFL